MNEVERHILFKGFFKSYKNWFFHGNGDLLQRELESDGRGSTSEVPLNDGTPLIGQDDMGGLLRSAFGVNTLHKDY